MTCRLFIDEVGNDDCVTPSERYLSLTGITTKRDADDRHITPEIEQLKRDLFGHNPPHKIVVLHRKEIRRAEAPFEALADGRVKAEWDYRILRLIEDLPYIANTVLIDKHEHLRRYGIFHFNPYHYCMSALVERYVLWLNRHGITGDVMAEERYKQLDKRLKEAFTHVYDHGTSTIPPRIIQRCLTSREIKLRPKSANICGLQLVDMIAHPSHYALHELCTGEVMTAPFGCQVVKLLKKSRYARDPKTGKIIGWGQKLLP